MDELEGFLCNHVQESGAFFGLECCQMILYADDLVLPAESAADLQQYLDALQSFVL